MWHASVARKRREAFHLRDAICTDASELEDFRCLRNHHVATWVTGSQTATPNTQTLHTVQKPKASPQDLDLGCCCWQSPHSWREADARLLILRKAETYDGYVAHGTYTHLRSSATTSEVLCYWGLFALFALFALRSRRSFVCETFQRLCPNCSPWLCPCLRPEAASSAPATPRRPHPPHPASYCALGTRLISAPHHVGRCAVVMARKSRAGAVGAAPKLLSSAPGSLSSGCSRAERSLALGDLSEEKRLYQGCSVSRNTCPLGLTRTGQTKATKHRNSCSTLWPLSSCGPGMLSTETSKRTSL